MAKNSRSERLNRINKMLELIKNEGMTAEELAKELNVTDDCIFSYVKILRKQKLLYICGYERTRGSPRKLYRAGNNCDAPKKIFVNPAKFKGDSITPRTRIPRGPEPDIAAAWMFNPINN